MIALARQQEFPRHGGAGNRPPGLGAGRAGAAHRRDRPDAPGDGRPAHDGAELQRPYRLALLAEAYAWIGQTAEALRLLDEALALTHQYGGHFYEAEVHRLTGELLLMQDAGGGVSGSPPPELSMIDGPEGEATGPSPRPTEAETWFRQALDIARRQQAKSLELRAATSLSRLWQQQDRRTEAYQLLAPIYGWFTEGFDTADLQDAKALLERY